MLKEKASGHKILLGSNSPRRQQLLADLDIPFDLVKIDSDEHYPEMMEAEKVAEYLAVQKSNDYETELKEKEILITADTIVRVNNEILNKPKDREDAIFMLNKLSGKMHIVSTGVCLRSPEQSNQFTDNTNVYFKYLSQNEIEYYVDNYKPFDKAGAYGIQEWIGYIGIDKIEGSYFNVMGLPVHRVYEALTQLIGSFKDSETSSE